MIADNTGGHLMQHGPPAHLHRRQRPHDALRPERSDKIGTYLKALAAHANDVPFYVALPASTFDWRIADGVKEIPIEERDGDEVTYIRAATTVAIRRVRLMPRGTPARDSAFDVTPARYVRP